jgi:hypothetical protein
MTLQQILALLMAKFTGVRRDGLTQLARVILLQNATIEDAQSAVDKLTDAQVNQFIKDYRADVDKEVSDSNKTYDANLRKKYDFVDKNNPEPGGDNHGNKDKKDDNNGNKDQATLIQEAVAAALKPIQDRLTQYEKADVDKSRLQKLNDALASCKNESFKAQTLKDFARMQFADDNSFNEYLTEKQEDIKGANQDFADTSMARSGGTPLFANKDTGGVSKAVADYVASKKPENNQFAGKEI